MNPFLVRALPRPARLLKDWSVASQQVARRNAMIAATRLAQQRAESLEVEELLTQLEASRLSETPAEETPARAAGS